MGALMHATIVTGWFELPKQDFPKRWMWHLDHEIEKWFQMVEERRKNPNGFEEDYSYEVEGVDYVVNEWDEGMFMPE